MSTNKQFLSLDEDKMDNVADFRMIRTWMPIIDSDYGDKKDSKSQVRYCDLF